MDEDEEGQGREGIKQERRNEGEVRLEQQSSHEHKHK